MVVSNAAGAFRAQLLALGRYSVRAELQGFKTFEQQGMTLSAGQTAVVHVAMTVGNLAETVTVTRQALMARPGKIDLANRTNG